MAEQWSDERIRQRAEEWPSRGGKAEPVRIFRDTSDFFEIEFGDVVVLAGRPFLVRHNAREGRFGIDDDVKFWVKRALDLTDQSRKFLKLVHYEKFTARVGDIQFECFRSPRKEARLLELAAGHPHFMQGYAVPDARGNLVRVIDHIYGPTLLAHVEDLRRGVDHAAYFHDHLPGILAHFVQAVDAIRFLHDHHEKHGDIRRDHILIDQETGLYRWIDFDYNYRHRENIFGYDLFGLGNVLIFLVGGGDVLLPELAASKHPALETLAPADLNIIFHHRVANLAKVYPYIPEDLNRVLLHFSQGSQRFYEHTRQLLEDLERCRPAAPTTAPAGFSAAGAREATP
jgi:hypothetical protein